jgi:hypothetical protein
MPWPCSRHPSKALDIDSGRDNINANINNNNNTQQKLQEENRPNKTGPEHDIQNRHVHLAPIGLSGFVEPRGTSWLAP